MRLSSVGLPLLLTAACATPGERNDTGQCPAGEVCSPSTPQGLTFDGAAFGDVWWNGGLHATATGGTQTITINNPATSSILSYAFTASTDATAFAVAAQRTGQVDVRATATGSDRLRIDSAVTGELFDRVGLTAAPVARVALRPSAAGEILSEDDLGGLEGIAVWRGTPVEVVVALWSSGDARLVDEDLRIVPDIGNQVAWDTVRVVGGSSGAMFLDLTFGAGTTLLASLGVTDQVDAIRPTTRPTGEDRTTILGSTDMLCLSASFQAYEVLGAPWQLTVTGPATAGGGLFRNCVAFQSTALGTVVVTAQIGSFRASFDIVVVNSAARAAAPAPVVPGPTPGERAIR